DRRVKLPPLEPFRLGDPAVLELAVDPVGEIRVAGERAAPVPASSRVPRVTSVTSVTSRLAWGLACNACNACNSQDASEGVGELLSLVAAHRFAGDSNRHRLDPVGPKQPREAMSGERLAVPVAPRALLDRV